MSKPQSSILDPLPNIDIRYFPTTSGQPSHIPKPDQLPAAYDLESNTLWMYLPIGVWQPVKISLSRLQPVDVSVLGDTLAEVRVPISYQIAGKDVEGDLPLQAFLDEIKKQL